MSQSDRVLADAEAVLRRHSERGRSLSARARQRRNAGVLRKLKYAFWAVLAILLGSAVAGFVVPLGVTGVREGFQPFSCNNTTPLDTVSASTFSNFGAGVFWFHSSVLRLIVFGFHTCMELKHFRKHPSPKPYPNGIGPSC